MADEIVGQEYPAKGTTYVIPKLENVADAVVAFKEYSDSIPFSEYIQTRTIADSGRAVEPVTEEDNGKMIVAQVDTTLQFGDLPEGFSVACVADSGVTITYQGVDKNGQQSTQYQVATVVTVGGLNILSLASPYDGSIGGDGGIAVPEGAPPAPIFIDKDGNDDASGGECILYFKSGGTGDAGETLAYAAEITPNSNGETVTIDNENYEIVISEAEPFTDYVVGVYGVNVAGRGETAKTEPFQLNYNEATGGDQGDEYVVTQEMLDGQYGDVFKNVGEKWRYHRFDSNGEFFIKTNVRDFRVLLSASGGGGAGGGPYYGQGGHGGAGGLVRDDAVKLDSGPYEVVIGNPGAGGANGNGSHNGIPGGRGENATFANFTAQGGGGGESYQGGCTSGGSGGGSYQNRAGGCSGVEGQGNKGGGAGGTSGYVSGGGGGALTAGGPNKGGTGLVDWIEGKSVLYSQGGNQGSATGGGGNGGQGGNGSGGKKGAVVIAYYTGMASTKEIKQAEALSEARKQGLAEGKEEGFEEGYAQAKEDLVTIIDTAVLSAKDAEDPYPHFSREKMQKRNG